MTNLIPNLIKETPRCYIVQSFEAAGIDIPQHVANHRIAKIKCPFCTPSAKSTNGKSLNVFTKEGSAKCHRAGCILNEKILRLQSIEMQEYKKEYIVPVFDKNLPLSNEHANYLLSRGIQMDTLHFFGVVSSDYGGSSKITFPYNNPDGSLCFLKYRAIDKSFVMSRSPRLIFFGLDKLDYSLNYVNIFEGEIDALSAYEAGVKNCVSVPNGAGNGLDYFENSTEALTGFEKYVLWTDNDAAGEKLKAALLQRIGAYRCELVKYPDGCKDCNDVLIKHAQNGVLRMFTERFAAPVKGIYSVSNKRAYLDDLRKNGRKGGYTISKEFGINIWRAMVGETTFVVGAPNSGKTTIIANMALWFAAEHGLKFLIVSPEDGDVANYMYKQIQMIANKWYFPYHDKTEPERLINDKEDAFCREFLEQHFTYLDAGDFNSIDDIFATIEQVNFDKGLFGVILDPFNSLPDAYSLDAAKQNALMAAICNKTRQMDICTIIGAHPNGMKRDRNGEYPKISFNDIQGGAAVSNKVDNILIINRIAADPNDPYDEARTEIEAIKIKLQPLNGETYRPNIIFYDAFSKSGYFSSIPNKNNRRQPLYEYLTDSKVLKQNKEYEDFMTDDDLPL